MSLWFVFGLVALAFAAFPALMYLRNVRQFRRPPRPLTDAPNASISVLIPARNEEAGIAACLEAILKSELVEFEVIVLDDHSTDRTAEIVEEIARRDHRVRLARSEALPDGWNGKQFACFQLSQLARHDLLSFLDADVRLGPTALARIAEFHRISGAGLVSGFPKQELGTWLERLIVPLINWLLLSYLPFDRMRKDKQPSLGAGCGQWFCCSKLDYERVGGHGHDLVRNSRHDGVKLPRAFRTHGFLTDVCDATQDATCRMYRSAGQVWNGFAKNACEGLGAPVLIWIWTILLVCGHILPFAMLLGIPWLDLAEVAMPIAACVLSLLPRIDAYFRYRQSLFGVLLHPAAIAGLIAIQWYAAVRHWLGKPVGWKGRAIAATTPASSAP